MTDGISHRPDGRQTGRSGESSGSVDVSGRWTVRKRKGWSRTAVSDIIGNLLILAITVTLFSSILWFVSSMPGPQEKVYSDFVSSVSVDDTSHKAYINITDKGGQTLQNFDTNIYLFQDNNPRTLHISDSVPSIGQSWVTGSTWSYVVNGVYSANTSLSIMIVDTSANTVVYNAPLLGGTQSAMSAPIIGDRGFMQNPVYDGQKVQFFAVVTDPYGTLNKSSIYVDASSIGQGNVYLTDDNHDNIYVSDPNSTYTASTDWTGATLIFYASDTNGKTTQARDVISVQPTISGGGGSGPFNNYYDYLTNGTYPPFASGGESGGDVGTTFYLIQRTSQVGTNITTRDFTAGEAITITIWSDTLQNVGLLNSLLITHPLTGELIEPQSSTAAFSADQIWGSFRSFVYNFTAPSDSYTYGLNIKVKDNRGLGLNINDVINVDGNVYPKLITCANVSGNLVPTNSFNHTDDLYLKIITKDVDLSASTVFMTNLQVSDYTGSYIIQKSPPTYAGGLPVYNDVSKPLSSLYKTNGSTYNAYTDNSPGGVYTMYIKLKDAYQGWWLPKTNDYTLQITTFSDSGTGGTTGEVYHSLSCQFKVTAPISTTDILASLGSGSFTWSASGATWENSQVVWFKGGDQWDYKTIDDSPSNGPTQLALADINGDGRNDAVVGCQDANYANIVWYENEKVDGSAWSSPHIVCNAFDALPGTQAAGNNDQGTANEDVTVYSSRDNSFETSYGSDSYICTNELVGSLAVADLTGSGHGDIIASFIHVVVYSTATSPGSANYGNSWGMFFNRGIYVFWNDGSWTRTTLYSTNDWIAANSANKNTNPAATDIAVGDFNQDGYPDITAVYEDGTTKVWMNQWATQTGTLANRENGAFGTAGSLRTLSVNVGGHNPWDHNQYLPRVRVGDMNGDGYPDIVRTSTSDNSVWVFYTQQSLPDSVVSWPVAEYPIDVNYTASRAGTTMANLTNSDGKYESLTEVYLNYPNQTLFAGTQPGDTTTGQLLSNTTQNDSKLYTVLSNPNQQMVLSGFSPPVDNSGDVVSKASLIVRWSADPAYDTPTKPMEYSTDGTNWYPTTIKPIGGQANQLGVFDLAANGVNTWAKLNSLQIRFVNSASGTAKNVYFDSVVLDVQFVQTRVVGWQWEVPNVIRAYHNFTVVGHVSGAESFTIQYSPDNSTWFDSMVFSSTTNTTGYDMLPYTPNGRYYIRAIDNNQGTDTVNDTLSLDLLQINHYAQTVTWDNVAGHTYKIPFNFPAQITGLAIGDMKKKAGVYFPNELNDIVVCTAQVDASHTLYILKQAVGTPGVYTPMSVPTQTLSVMCPDDSLYDARNLELGDTNGDGTLDIILVIGPGFGRDPGTGPTLWQYTMSYNGASWTSTEEPVNQLSVKGESAINVELGYIDLSIFLPLFGVVGIVAASAAVERLSRRRSK